MNLFLSKSFNGNCTLTNYCPYKLKSEDILRDYYFYYPYWLGGNPFTLHASECDLEGLGVDDLEIGTIKNIATGQIIHYKDLLTMDDHSNNIYYAFGL